MLWKYLSKECSFNVLLNQARPLEENNRRVRDGPLEKLEINFSSRMNSVFVKTSLVRIFLGKGMNIFWGQKRGYLARMNFFPFHLPLHEYFLHYARSLPPPPHNPCQFPKGLSLSFTYL